MGICANSVQFQFGHYVNSLQQYNGAHIECSIFNIHSIYYTQYSCRLSSWKYSSDNAQSLAEVTWVYRSHLLLSQASHSSLNLTFTLLISYLAHFRPIISYFLTCFFTLMFKLDYLFYCVNHIIFPRSFMSLLVLCTALSSQRLGPLFIRSKDNPTIPEEAGSAPSGSMFDKGLPEGAIQMCSVMSVLLHSGYCNKYHRLNDL